MLLVIMSNKQICNQPGECLQHHVSAVTSGDGRINYYGRWLKRCDYECRSGCVKNIVRCINFAYCCTQGDSLNLVEIDKDTGLCKKCASYGVLQFMQSAEEEVCSMCLEGKTSFVCLRIKKYVCGTCLDDIWYNGGSLASKDLSVSTVLNKKTTPSKEIYYHNMTQPYLESLEIKIARLEKELTQKDSDINALKDENRRLLVKMAKSCYEVK